MADVTITRTITVTEAAALDAYAAANNRTRQEQLDHAVTELLSDATTYFQTNLKTLLPAAWVKATDQEKITLITQLRTIAQRP